MLVRDVEGRFHARWISEANFNTLPTELEQDILQQRQREVGVKFMDTTAANTIARQIYERLMRHHNVLIYGPPGTGKTHIMQEVARLFQNPDYYVDTANETSPITMEGGNNAKVGWVTFHQSYSYEDFIVGLRPDPQANQLLSLVPVPGILLELSEHARPQGNSSLLIIDEINRGNVSRIFGEFITLLEPDKRLSEAGAVEDRTVSVRLAYVKPGTPIEIDPPGGTRSVVPNPFTMPRRLYTLASMNSVDKSIAPLDTALRRRFDIFELPPDLGGMAEHMGFENSLDLRQLTLPATLQNPDHVKKLALALLYSLNHDIGFYLGPEFSLGQWYISDLARTFDTLDEAESVLIDIWNYKLLPQLVELFHGRIEQLEAVLDLGESEGTNNDPIFLVRPEEAMVEIGASPYIKPRVVETAAIIGYFRRVAGVGSEAETPAALPLTEVVEEAGEAEAGETAEGTGNTEV
jgi:DNA polymerase III delta prime subunit